VYFEKRNVIQNCVSFPKICQNSFDCQYLYFYKNAKDRRILLLARHWVERDYVRKLSTLRQCHRRRADLTHAGPPPSWRWTQAVGLLEGLRAEGADRNNQVSTLALCGLRPS
jgi:hypothetical protein